MSRTRPALDPTFRQPAQQRSRASLRRTYDAVNKLLLDRPFDQITIAEISLASGVSVGSIYQRFRSKDNLLWALYDAYLDEATRRMKTLMEDPVAHSLDERVYELVRLVSSLFRRHRGIVKSLLLKHRQVPEQVPGVYLHRIEAVYSTAQRFLRDACPQGIQKRDLEFGFSLLMASCREHLLFSEMRGIGSTQRSDPEFARRLATAVTALLPSQSDNPGDRG